MCMHFLRTSMYFLVLFKKQRVGIVRPGRIKVYGIHNIYIALYINIYNICILNAYIYIFTMYMHLLSTRRRSALRDQGE